MALERLEFVYMPSRDVAGDARYFTDVLGARLVFAIEATGTKVAMIELGEPPPRILLAGHLEGETPVLIFRVGRLAEARAELEGRGWRCDRTLEIPQGPCCSLRAPGGQRIAIYEPTRPDVEASFAGRRDF